MKSVFLFLLLLLSGTLVMVNLASPVSAEDKIGVVVVDLQGDFTTFKKGSLAVEGTDEAFIQKVGQATKELKEKGYPVFATQDWHPADHVSFFSNHSGKKPFEAIEIEGKTQVLWPPHCVQQTPNAQILLDKDLFTAVVQKGKDPRYDSYSGFKDDGGAKTELEEILKKEGLKNLIVYGIATDYCVKATAIDAAEAGFKVTVIQDLCKGVAPDTSAQAIEEMKAKGITIKTSLD